MEITKKMLKEHQNTKKEIVILTCELQEMEAESSVIMNGCDGTKKPEHVMGIDIEKYNRRKETLLEKKRQVEAVERWIENIDDAVTRTVFRKYYKEGKNWMKVAQETGAGGNEDYPRICIRDHYLKKMGIV